ncbi:DNA/RNA non-specific endonuclease [Aerococcus viridans]|uniref:DNA/RNA non-specific endonuclease n=1 Tax=Aerococcus viridans TaxID=1377 RepID=UPI003AA90753
MKKKNINWLRLLAYLALLIIFILLSPFILVVAPILALFFYKIKPNNQWLRNSLIASAAALIGTIVIFSIDTGETEANQSDLQPQEQVISSDQDADENSADDSESAAEEAAAKSAKDASQKSSKESYDRKLAAESSARQASSKKRAESESKEKAAAESKAKAESEIASQASAEFTKVRTVPAGQTYIEINNNIPYFTDVDITSTEAYESYGELDSLGRVTAANAVLGVELMPTTERGDISDIKPTGWQQAKYANVSGGWLYNRSHLIGHQLTGEDANAHNLMTGTRWFNTEGMLPFENFVANYIEQTENHVRYRVTPAFEGDNLLASGVYMEGFSIEDNGATIQFNIYVPNIQPDVEINYADGSSVGPEGPTQDESLPNLNQSSTVSETAPAAESAPATTAPASGGDVGSVDANGNGQVTIKEAKAAGFSMPIYADHWLYPYMDDRDGDGMVGE